MQKQLETPLVQEHFNDDEEDDKSNHRLEAIKQFALQQITLAPTMFKHCLADTHIFLIMAILVPQAMQQVTSVLQGQQSNQQSKFRLFQLISALQKIKLSSTDGSTVKKGFIADGDRLWLQEINLKVLKILKSDETTKSVAKQHKKILKFVKKSVTSLRKQLFETDEKNEERKLKLMVEAKRALALEKMILSFALAMCLPDELEQMSETLSQVEELMECFSKLHLGEIPGRKQPINNKQGEERQEALKVLFDLLISLLAKANSFLREIANYVFKQFCSELDEGSLEQLLKVIATPNEKVAEMFEEGSDSEGGEDEEEYDEEEESDSN